MNMGTPSSSMASMSMSMAMSSATASGMAGMSGMGDGGSSMPACNMQMIWNWNVIDDCLIAGSWHITSKSMFAGSCIGVIGFVVALEFVRRLSREYDRMIVRNWKANKAKNEDPEMSSGFTTVSLNEKLGLHVTNLTRHFGSRMGPIESFSPTLVEHTIRSILYAVVVGAGYILMLLAMSFNGYIIFCIIIGALIGYFFFGSDNITDGLHQETSIACC
ncbi:Ctr3p [Sugiyamaella lignohabitans]|uniref:Copper transport protein n=1 Tax=Sugiyamaella lignohabitans TaxID=796027 RepID=A0A167EJ76_9ASCO|nr:Ctr3p [Sugiyamaella lignohabitans]ANB14144.1 Ctr3p [Sugiyamaella lignohabitans]